MIPIGIPINEAKTEIEIHSVIVEINGIKVRVFLGEII